MQVRDKYKYLLTQNRHPPIYFVSQVHKQDCKKNSRKILLNPNLDSRHKKISTYEHIFERGELVLILAGAGSDTLSAALIAGAITSK